MNRKGIRGIFERAGAILLDDHFVYSSGRHGSSYINKNAIYIEPSKIRTLCSEIAQYFLNSGIEVVCGPATGGIILSQWVAFHLSMMSINEVLSVYADKSADGFVIKRGYEDVMRDKRILVVEDITTTGTSARQVIKESRKYGEVVGLGLLCNREGVEFDIPTFSLLEMELKTYKPSECPLCEKGIPINIRIGKGKEFLLSQNK